MFFSTKRPNLDIGLYARYEAKNTKMNKLVIYHSQSQELILKLNRMLLLHLNMSIYLTEDIIYCETFATEKKKIWCSYLLVGWYNNSIVRATHRSMCLLSAKFAWGTSRPCFYLVFFSLYRKWKKNEIIVECIFFSFKLLRFSRVPYIQSTNPSS